MPRDDASESGKQINVSVYVYILVYLINMHDQNMCISQRYLMSISFHRVHVKYSKYSLDKSLKREKLISMSSNSLYKTRRWTLKVRN